MRKIVKKIRAIEAQCETQLVELTPVTRVVSTKFAVYVASILLCKYCKFG